VPKHSLTLDVKTAGRRHKCTVQQMIQIARAKSIRVIHAIADIPSIPSYILERHPVYAVFDAVTRRYPYPNSMN